MAERGIIMIKEYLDDVARELAWEEQEREMNVGTRDELDWDLMSASEKWERVMRDEGLEGTTLLYEHGQPTIGFGRPDTPVDVSVIVPTYNMERYLRQAVESALLSGSVANMEVICVNDGSSDSSLDIMGDLARSDSRVVVIDKENGGYGSAVNCGLDAARGRYVAILEPDDWVEPGMYDALFALASDVAERHGGTYPDVVKSSYWRVVGSGTEDEHRLHCSYYKRLPDRGEPFRIEDEPHLVMHHPSIWSALYRREFLDGNSIRMMEVPGAGWVDNPWLYETMCQARSIVYTNKAWYCYREDLAGSSSSGDVMLLSLERWNDMMDIVDRLGVADEGVRASLHVIGFRYLQDILAHDGMEDPDVRARAEEMLRRMDLSVVSSIENVSPGLLAMAFEAQGEVAPEMSPAPYRRMLVREFGKTVQTDGVGTAFEKVAMKLRAKSK